LIAIIHEIRNRKYSLYGVAIDFVRQNDTTMCLDSSFNVGIIRIRVTIALEMIYFNKEHIK
jgi:hypothetical protein